jgi:nucleoside-diphosphate-sugar epimerase
MRILVTGGNGFVAGHLIRDLAGRHEVVALARGGPRDEVPEGVRWVEHDLTEPLAGAGLPAEIDAVVHLAQSRHYKEFPERADDIFGVNVQGTFRLLEYAREAGARSFVFTSTGGVYGYSYERFVETDPVSPLGFYLTSKYAAELLIANYKSFFHTIVLRLFFVYGPGQEGMLIPNLLGRVRRGETVTIEGPAGLRINPIYVSDAVRVFEPALALETSEVFNVAGDEAVHLAELVRLMGEVTGRPASIEHSSSSPDGDLVADIRRMKDVLGVTPGTSLADGLRSML